MLLHAKQGVDEGIKENGVPVEVMGCLVGYADIDEPGFVVITDCFEVPCKEDRTPPRWIREQPRL